MATAPALISIEEYLHTAYRPDVDYIDGHIEERNLGEYDHGRLQMILGIYFYPYEREWNLRTVAEQRIRVSPTRIRICDVALLSREVPVEPVAITPPIACIEILSPEDRLPPAAKVMDDYSNMGVQNLWLLDPTDQIAYTYEGNDRFQIVQDRLTIPNSPIQLDLPTLFASTR